MHKVKIVQKISLLPIKERLAKMKEAGFNTFMLHNGDIFLDMLTDSGVNAMSDNMQAAMLRADDAYVGSETFTACVTSWKRFSALPTCFPRIRAVPASIFCPSILSSQETASL